MMHVCHSFNFLFAVEEALCFGAKNIAASMHITKKASEIVQINVISGTLRDSYSKQKLVKEEESIFVKKNP
jgi:hypothetical protein